LLALIFQPLAVQSGESGWIDLMSEPAFTQWRSPTGNWFQAADALLDPRDQHYLIALPGKGVFVNGWNGRTNNLKTKQLFADIEAHAEFLVSSKSNSGIKFEGLYEIQIFDSWGVQKPAANDCGGIYPRAELLPKYHHLDLGTPPRTNAARRPGEWQTLDVIFQAPVFAAEGKKIQNARFVRVALNGVVIHENVDLKSPTGHAWREREIPVGPLLLQADHGPVAFRNLRVKPFRRP
jgi:hypothetical protein